MVARSRRDHDGDMNETLHDQGQAADRGPTATPPPPAPHRDLDRLRRSTSNRYIAGVAGGLGRHFDVDPTILRVLLVVLTFFGGAGLVIYAACWLFVPEDDSDHAVIHIGTEPRKILLLAAAAVAFLLAVGNAFHGFNGLWPIVGIAVVIAIVLMARDRRHERRNAGAAAGSSPGTPMAPPPPAPYAPPATAATTSTPMAPPGAAPATEETALLPGLLPGGTQPPSWQPPVAGKALVPPRPKRTGVIWFWPTLALIAVGLGVLGIYDHSHEVVDGAYPALALAITAVMLLVGSVVGRPGGLILLGFLSSVALAGSVVVGGSFGVDAKQIDETPTSSAQVQSVYANTVGEIRLDLTEVTDPEALAGRTLHLHQRTGYIEVVVPRSLNVEIDAKMAGAGGVRIPGNDSGGFNHSAERTLRAVPASTSAPLQLDLDAKFGQITVEYR